MNMIRKVSVFALMALIAAMLISCNSNVNPSGGLGVPTSIATESLDRVVIVTESSESRTKSIVPINPEINGNNVLCNMAKDYLEPILFNTSNGKLVALSVGYYHLAPGYMICQVAGVAECDESDSENSEASLDLNFRYFRVPVLIDFSSGRVFDLSGIVQGDLGYGPNSGTALLYDDDFLYFRASDVVYRIPKADSSHAYPLNNPEIYRMEGTLSLAGNYIISSYDMKAFKKNEIAKALDASPVFQPIEHEGYEFNLWQTDMSYPLLSFFIARDGSEWRLARGRAPQGSAEAYYFVNVSFEEENGKLIPHIKGYFKAEGMAERGAVKYARYSSSGVEVTSVMDFVYCTIDSMYQGVADSYYTASANTFYYDDGYVQINATGSSSQPLEAIYTTVSYPAGMDFGNVSGDYAYYETSDSIVRTSLLTGRTESVIDDSRTVYSWSISGNTLTYINIVDSIEMETWMIDLNDSRLTPVRLSSEGMSVVELPELTVGL